MKRVLLASGIELDFVDEGPRDAPALIFLHGFPESHRTWRHQIAHFADRYRCIAPDQRGYRGSSKPQDVESYTPDKLAGDVFQLADALGIETFTVVGHDWGGAIAWIVAMLGQGSRVERAAIANAPHPAVFAKLQWVSREQRQASQYFRAFRDRANDALVHEFGLAGMLAKAFAGADFRIMDAAMRDMALERMMGLVDPEVREAQLTDWLDRDAAFGMLNWYRASPIDVPPMDAPFELPQGWSPPPLPNLSIPTLVIWAMDDIALPPVNLDELKDHVQDLTLVQVPDCGHFVTWQAPEAVNKAIEAFLTG
ncbi:MAG: alpha/beta fold hydrolase [Novosphingobium sp.]